MIDFAAVLALLSNLYADGIAKAQALRERDERIAALEAENATLKAQSGSDAKGAPEIR